MEDPHHSEHTSDHLAVVYDDRVHRIVFRLQTDVILFFIETFYCSFVIDTCYNNITIISRILMAYNEHITFIHTNIHHGLALNA